MIESETIEVVSLSSISSGDSLNSKSDDEKELKGGPESLADAILHTGYAKACVLEDLKKSLDVVKFEPGSVVCERGREIEGMYIVLDVAPVMMNEGSGDIVGFGELIDSHGLMYSASTSADTVRCIGACHCACLHRSKYEDEQWQTFRDTYLRSNIPLMQFMDIKRVNFRYEIVEAGDTLVSFGEIIVVIDGVIFSKDDGKDGDHLNYYPGHILGVLERLGGSMRSRFVVHARCICAFITQEGGDPISDGIDFSMAIMESAYQRSVMKEIKSHFPHRTVLYRCESQGHITLAPVVPTATMTHEMGNLKTVNEFTITGHLGTGSTARVFECCSDMYGKVALKMVYKSKARESFHREIMALQDLKHPNIVSLKLIINDLRQDVAFLVEEMATRGTLVGMVMTSSLQCQRVASEIMGALRHMHDRGYVHRDVKPANILIMDDGKAKLTDFGCAIRWEERSKRTNFMGTPAFMAPELFSTGSITPAVDVWSLVGTMHYVVYGTLPFGVEGSLISHTIMYSAPGFGTIMTPRCQKMIDDNWTNDDISRFKHFCKEGLRKDPDKRVTLENLSKHDWVIYT